MKQIEALLPMVIPAQNQIPFNSSSRDSGAHEPFVKIGIVPTGSLAYQAVTINTTTVYCYYLFLGFVHE